MDPPVGVTRNRCLVGQLSGFLQQPQKPGRFPSTSKCSPAGGPQVRRDVSYRYASWERSVGRKGVRSFESKRKDKGAEKEGKREGRKEGANVYKQPAWKTLQWTLSLTLVKCTPFFPFFLRSPSSLKFPPYTP